MAICIKNQENSFLMNFSIKISLKSIEKLMNGTNRMAHKSTNEVRVKNDWLKMVSQCNTKYIMNYVKMAGTYSNSNENVAEQLSKMSTGNIKMRLILFRFVPRLQVFQEIFHSTKLVICCSKNLERFT